jgi:ornithine carbamoyltransferase
MNKQAAHAVLDRALEMKRTAHRSDLLAGKTIALVFEKASTRTRVSFEVAVRQLGGDVLFMTPAESQLGRSEPLKDTARVLSRYVDGLVVRTFGQEKLEEIAEYADVPVVNALSDLYHPCQVMSDLLTISERTPDLEQVRVAWMGDGNNMAHSWINAAVRFPFELFMGVPKGFEPKNDIVEIALQMGAKIFMSHDPEMALDGAHYVNTDVWASMGQEAESLDRAARFRHYQVNEESMAKAAEGALFMHCLPAHRGEEVTEEVIEGPASIVWDQAENRLHMQKAILEWIYGDAEESGSMGDLPSAVYRKKVVV